MPISLAPENVAMKVAKITADDKTRRHLQELGICEGGEVTLVSKSPNGVIIIVKEGRLCLDGVLARRILVA
ncbi:MAG: ferrous iron transport protein A [Candidatus Coproplasma sp.]